MSYSVRNNISEQERGSNGTNSSAAVNCCSNAPSQLKIYQAFIFSVPIFFTFILLFLFYWFYLRRQRADWSSLRMRANNSVLNAEIGDDISRCELGLKKELREMLPIIVFKESFSVKDTQCIVCLGEYQAEERLQQIPGCGHTFHMDCIDLWLTSHTTCPLCRQSLLASSKTPSDTVANTNNRTSNADQRSHEDNRHTDEEGHPETSEQPHEGEDRDESEQAVQAVSGKDETGRGVESVK